MNEEQRGPPIRFSSPSLVDSPLEILRECPVGYLLRESSWVFDAIDAVARLDGTSVREWRSMPRWFQHVARVVGAERSRLREEDRERDAAFKRSAESTGVKRGR